MLTLGPRTFNLKWLGWGLLIVAGVVAGLILNPRWQYLGRVLWYQFAEIDDYQIFPSRLVPAGPGQPWAFASDYNQVTLSPERLNSIEQYDPVAFLVVQNNELVYERYWEEHTPTAYSSSFSMAKSIVSLLVGIALEEGKIQSLDQPISDFIPEFRSGPKAKITFRHLLTMTSGLRWDEAYTSPFSPTAELYYGDDLYRLVVNLTLQHEPGTVWYYSSADTQLLGLALERALGQTLSAYASQKLWQPLGAEQAATWSLDREAGNTKGNCCFNSTARDFARLGQLVLQGGVWNQQQIIPADYLAEATRPALGLKNAQGEMVDYYGYQFWIVKFDEQRVPYFNGILGQYIFVMPHLNAVTVRLGHRDDPNFNDALAYHQATRDILSSR